MKSTKATISYFKMSILCFQNRCPRRFIILLLLLLPFFSFSQLSDTQNQLLNILTKALHTLQEVRHQQENLLTNSSALQDSINLEAAIAQLKDKGLSESELVQKADSLRQAFAAYQNKLEQLQSQEEKLINQIQDLQQKVPAELLPPEARKLLGQINPISSILPKELSSISGISKPTALPRGQMPQLKIPPAASLPSQVKQVTEGPIDFFAGREKELNEARRELRKYSSRMDEIKSLKDLGKGYLWINPLKGKPWPERVVVGSLWQFSNQEQYHIDLGPSLAWRLTDLFSLGAGFQYRLSVSAKSKPWVNSADKVFGYHAFFDGQIKKGFFGRLQYENLSTLVPRPDPATQLEMTEQEWVKGLSVGIGRTYKFYKKINGYGLMQYNLLYRHNETPYLRPVQAKIGFYINSSSLVKPKQVKEQTERKQYFGGPLNFFKDL